MEWQTIETAPKDGTKIDLWTVWVQTYRGETTTRSERLTDCWWGAPSHLGPADIQGDQWCREEQCHDEWYVDGVEVRSDDSTVTVTHWMPVPAPPASGPIHFVTRRGELSQDTILNLGDGSDDGDRVMSRGVRHVHFPQGTTTHVMMTAEEVEAWRREFPVIYTRPTLYLSREPHEDDSSLPNFDGKTVRVRFADGFEMPAEDRAKIEGHVGRAIAHPGMKAIWSVDGLDHTWIGAAHLEEVAS